MADPVYLKRFNRTLQALQALPDLIGRLDAVRECIAELEELEATTVAAARADGATWKQIGVLYGLSKQGAQQRFRRSTTDEPTGRSPLPG